MSKRISLLPSKTFKTYGPAPQTNHVCVGCGSSVNPGFCYTGSVIDGLAFTTVKGIENTPILGTIESYDRSYVIGGEEIETVKRVSFYKRKKGLICESCSSNYHTITDARGTKHQIIKTDARPGYVSYSRLPAYETILPSVDDK